MHYGPELYWLHGASSILRPVGKLKYPSLHWQRNPNVMVPVALIQALVTLVPTVALVPNYYSNQSKQPAKNNPILKHPILQKSSSHA
jgi:hypothetical protein